MTKLNPRRTLNVTSLLKESEAVLNGLLFQFIPIFLKHLKYAGRMIIRRSLTQKPQDVFQVICFSDSQKHIFTDFLYYKSLHHYLHKERLLNYVKSIRMYLSTNKLWYVV